MFRLRFEEIKLPDNVNVFFISDTHFYHDNIIKYCNRPYTNTYSMNVDIVNNWNNKVSENDLVFHLGDVSFSDKNKTKDIITQLKGTKILLKGNHDKGRTNKWFVECGFDKVYNKDFLLINNNKIILSHYPIDSDLIGDYYNIHGHIHNNKLSDNRIERFKNVSVEAIGYTPISFEEIKEGFGELS